MSSNLYELKALTNIPGFPILIPNCNVKQYLLENKHLFLIDEPEQFVKGLVVEIDVLTTDILVLLKNEEAFNGLKVFLKAESIEWYQLRGLIFKNELI